MGYFPVRYDSRVVNYDRRGFIRLATDWAIFKDFGNKFSCKNILFGHFRKHITFSVITSPDYFLGHFLENLATFLPTSGPL